MANDAQKTVNAAPTGIRKGLIIILLAAAVSILTYHLLPYDVNANKGLALLLFVALLWFTEAINITVTALMIPVLAVALGFPGMNTQQALSSFADPIIFLFFGGFALATALQVQRLDRKIAMWILSLSKSHLATSILLLFATTMFLSLWISNTATAAMMLPLAMGITSHLDRDEDHGTHVFILLGIAYSASIGGLGTMISTPPNAIAARALNMDFADWLQYGLPVMLIFMPLMVTALYLILRPKLNRRIELKLEHLPWTAARIFTLMVFFVTAGAWIFSGKLGSYFTISSPDAWIAVTAAVVIVATGLASWEQLKQNTNWGVLYLFGGGLTLSALLQNSGASLVLGQQVASLFGDAHPLLIIFAVAVLILFFTEFASNTASAALFVPIFASIAVEIGMPKEVLVMVIAIGASCAFMLPVATPPNALVFATGQIRQTEMIRVGFVLNLIAVVLITLLGYIILQQFQ